MSKLKETELYQVQKETARKGVEYQKETVCQLCVVGPTAGAFREDGKPLSLARITRTNYTA